MKQMIHLHPTAPLAERVLLPGDPGRALRLAQSLLQEPRMFNHNRGLWGYTGTASDGEELTIQSTGMGGPSAAIVITELIRLGVQRLIRVGTCGALSAELKLGQLLIVSEAIAADGTSRRLLAAQSSSPPGVRPDTLVLQALEKAAPTAACGPVVSTDLFYDPFEPEAEWARSGALAVEMEAATLFALASGPGGPSLQAGALLAISDLILPARERIEARALEAAEIALGQTALRALGSRG